MINLIKHEISNLSVHSEGHLTSKHKPLLVLLVLKSILDGRKSNSYKYEEIDSPLSELLNQNKINRTDAESTYYPFYYLVSSNLWSTNVKIDKGKTPKKSNVKGKTGTFNYEMFQYLTDNLDEVLGLIDYTIELYWGARSREKVKAFLLDMKKIN